MARYGMGMGWDGMRMVWYGMGVAWDAMRWDGVVLVVWDDVVWVVRVWV